MRIYAIRNYESGRTVSKMNQKYGTNVIRSNDAEPKQDTCSFKGGEMVKGIGIGTLLGLGAITFISGGTAAPIALGIISAATGTAGGVVGKALEDINNSSNKNN